MQALGKGEEVFLRVSERVPRPPGLPSVQLD